MDNTDATAEFFSVMYTVHEPHHNSKLSRKSGVG